MGIHIMPRKGRGLIARLLGIDPGAYSAGKVVDDAYARTKAQTSPDLKNAYRAYKNAEEARERKNKSG